MGSNHTQAELTALPERAIRRGSVSAILAQLHILSCAVVECSLPPPLHKVSITALIWGQVTGDAGAVNLPMASLCAILSAALCRDAIHLSMCSGEPGLVITGSFRQDASAAANVAIDDLPAIERRLRRLLRRLLLWSQSDRKGGSRSGQALGRHSSLGSPGLG